VQHFSGVVWFAPLGLPRQCGICIQQGAAVVAATTTEEEAEEDEEEDGTPHVDTWRNARVWVDSFVGLHQ
jgi:hypothetical protein